MKHKKKLDNEKNERSEGSKKNCIPPLLFKPSFS
jgi:hypothetical protein